MIIATALAMGLQIGNPNGGATTPSRGEFERQVIQQQDQQHDKGAGSFGSSVKEWPTLREMQAAYPADALAKNTPGQATLRCMIDKSGGLNRCHVASEMPRKAGFGDAAMKLAPLFKVETKDSDGLSIVGTATEIPIRFDPNAKP